MFKNYFFKIYIFIDSFKLYRIKMSYLVPVSLPSVQYRTYVHHRTPSLVYRYTPTTATIVHNVPAALPAVHRTITYHTRPAVTVNKYSFSSEPVRKQIVYMNMKLK
jgi:hypothetical protein